LAHRRVTLLTELIPQSLLVSLGRQLVRLQRHHARRLARSLALLLLARSAVQPLARRITNGFPPAAIFLLFLLP
jgi:hypothetical protein